MQPMQPKNHGDQRPEAKIQKAIVKMLTNLGWLAKATHGNAYSRGWPDIFASHPIIGHRWIEVKLPNMKGSKYTAAQLEWFPKFKEFGSGVWVLTAASDEEYKKLFDAPNWIYYLDVFK